MSPPIGNIQKIFDRVVEAPEPERLAVLDALCGGDAAMRHEVQRLLEADRRSARSNLLAGPVDAEYAAAALELRADRPPPPEHIGPYRVVRQLGEGGFGLVYLAERRQPFQQVVAVKVLKPGMDSRAILARFAHEREALAMLSHPNIARIFDAGQTESGYPYFVMDFVEGEPITRYCRDHALSAAETVGVLIDVGSAIQHAHARGIIHRDIKPTNIIVHRHGDRLRATVIDFGIAKVLSPDGAPSQATEMLAMLGTPEYMSPEQALLGPASVDTRADVYGLGAVLYELLTGAPPLDPARARDATPAALCELLRNIDPSPPRVDDRPAHWPASAAMMHRELGWIALKALRPNRDDRYQSVAEFIGDLRACMTGGTVSAGPSSRFYVARKLVRRHRGPLLAAAGLVFGLLMVAGVQMQAARRERGLRLAADEALRIAEARQVQLASAQTALSRQGVIANLAAASALIEAGDAIAARSRLIAVPADSRAWEWGLLWTMTDDSLAKARPFSTMIECLSLSPDERLLAVAANLGGITVLDTQSLQTVRTFGGHEGQRSISCLFHPADPALITGGYGGTLRVYSTPSFVIQREIQVDAIDDLRCSPDGRTIAYRQPQTRVAVVLEYPGLTERARFGSGVSDLAFIADGSLMAVAGGHRLQITDPTGRISLSAEIPVDFADIAVSPDGRLVAAACSEQTIVFRTDTLQAIRTITHESAVGMCLFAPDGRSLLTMGLEQVLRRWDLSSGRLLDRRLAPVHGLRAGPLTRSGDEFFGGSDYGWVLRWPVRDTRSVHLPGARTSFAAIDRSGRRVALCSWRSGTLRILDSDSMSVSNTIATGWMSVDSVAFTKDQNTVLVAGHLGAATVDLPSGRLRPLPVPGRHEAGANIVPLPDGRWVFGFPSQTPCIIEPLTAAVVQPPGFNDMGLPIGASPSGRWVAFHNPLHDVAVVDMSNGRLAFTMPGQRDRTHVAAFSPDDRWVALANWSDHLAIHDLVSGQLILELPVSGGSRSAAVTPDGRRLIVSDVGGYLRVFDTADFASLLTMRVGAGWSAAYLTGDAGRMITFDVNDRVRTWSIAPSGGEELDSPRPSAEPPVR